MGFIETATLLLLAIFHDMEMTQFWSINNICQVCKLKLLFFKIMDNIYIDRLLLNIFFRSAAIVFETVHLEIYVSGHCANFHNSEIDSRRKLPDPTMRNIFNVLSNGL